MSARSEDVVKAISYLLRQGPYHAPTETDSFAAIGHGLLALVEQQRIANLIALAQLRSDFDEVEGQSYALASEALWALTRMVPVEQTAFQAMDGPEQRVAVNPDIAAALGLSEDGAA